MKPTELMIGDWVSESHSGCIDAMNDVAPYDENIQLQQDDFDLDECFFGRLSPIPLTPEILAKNGFKVMHGFGYCEKYPTYGWGYHKEVRDYASVDVTFYNEPIAGVSTLVRMETNSSKGDGVNMFHSCDCDYVHQLQHALRLAGIEKEITL